jgi:hypothetical protein
MNKKKIFGFVAVIACFLLFASCKKNVQSATSLFPVNSDNKTTINIDINSEIINIGDVIDSVEYTPLETTDDCLIGEINKIIYHDNKYYILDRVKAKTLFCFDAKGRFERKFGNLGQGPGEYVEPTDFMLTPSNIIIFDQFARKLLFFNMDGTFSYSVALKYKMHAITSLENDSLFLATLGDNRNTDLADYELLVMDTKGEVRLKGIHNPYRMNYSLSGYNSRLMNGRTIHAKPMSSSIYEITETEMTERYHLNITNRPLPKNYEELCKGNYENFMKNYKGSYNYFSGQFIETDKFLFFTVVNTKNMPVSVIYNKESGEIKSGILGMHGGNGSKFDKIGFIVLSINSYMTVNKNNIIGYVDASYMSDKEEEDNPILFSFKLKD